MHPAWNDRNLREAARAIRSRMFIAHIRAATDTPVQETNCHPFRHGRWLFAHNGLIRDFHKLRRDLTMKVDPALFPTLEGSTDSELMFRLALTYGLEQTPLPALERMVGVVEESAARHRVADPLNMTICATDGERIIAVRYSSERQSRSLFHSTSFSTCTSCIRTTRASPKPATTRSWSCPSRSSTCGARGRKYRRARRSLRRGRCSSGRSPRHK